MHDGEIGLGVVLGVIMSVVLLLWVFHVEEAECQREYNVHDCEWSRTPFQPVERELK